MSELAKLRRFFICVVHQVDIHADGTDSLSWPLAKRGFTAASAAKEVPETGDNVLVLAISQSKPIVAADNIDAVIETKVIHGPQRVELSDRPNTSFPYWATGRIVRRFDSPGTWNSLDINPHSGPYPTVFEVTEPQYSWIADIHKVRRVESTLKKLKAVNGRVWDSRWGRFLEKDQYLRSLDEHEVLSVCDARLREASDTFLAQFQQVYFGQFSDLEAIKRLSPKGFENLCAQVARGLRFEELTTVSTGDLGVDIEAYERHRPFTKGKYVIQCKRTQKVGAEVVRQLGGTVESSRAVKGILLTTGQITQPARQEAIDNPKIELFDGNEFVALLNSLDLTQPLSSFVSDSEDPD